MQAVRVTEFTCHVMYFFSSFSHQRSMSVRWLRVLHMYTHKKRVNLREKRTFPCANNKNSDQPALMRRQISVFAIRYVDSI